MNNKFLLPEKLLNLTGFAVATIGLTTLSRLTASGYEIEDDSKYYCRVHK